MPRLWIPSLIRDLTGGKDVVEVPGSRVSEALDALERLHPGVKARLCEGGVLRSGLTVVVGSEVCRLGLRQPIEPDSEIHFVQAIGGGSR